jgi:hypothetical protein
MWRSRSLRSGECLLAVGIYGSRRVIVQFVWDIDAGQRPRIEVGKRRNLGKAVRLSAVPLADLFGRWSWPEVRRIADVLRTKTIGGVLLPAGTVTALM